MAFSVTSYLNFSLSMRGRFSDLNKINIFSYQFHCLQLDKSNQYFFFCSTKCVRFSQVYWLNPPIFNWCLVSYNQYRAWRHICRFKYRNKSHWFPQNIAISLISLDENKRKTLFQGAGRKGKAAWAISPPKSRHDLVRLQLTKYTETRSGFGTA